MRTISKTSVIVFLTLIIQQSFAAVHWDDYRREVKQMVVKNHRPLINYGQARVFLMGKVHLEEDGSGYFVKDVYCGKTHRNRVGPNTVPNHNVINVEHTWPQSRFNRRQSKVVQKSDLHHLYPTDSRANGKRGNYYFAEFAESAPAVSHDCTASYFDRGDKGFGFEPPQSHKGNVARALFYFSIRYDIEIPEHEEVILRLWNIEDPADESEKRRNETIESIQGNRNPFIDDADLVELITNF